MSQAKLAERPRLANGRFIKRLCSDPNCGGELVRDTELPWPGGPSHSILRCDGLTFTDDNGPLIACEITHRSILTSQDTDK